MKIAPTFEIKVAVIGPVSAGKSTLINALLVGKYSEVSIRRTTAGVNYFRLTPPTEDDGNDAAASSTTDTSGEGIEAQVTTGSAATATKNSTSGNHWSLVPDKVDTEDDILKQISVDNKKLRELEKVQEKIFDIEGIQLCDMRKDTILVIVDIPGINEAESSSKYRDYVKTKWSTFDCVILVMDARHGVNTEEQVDLLDFVKKSMEESKDIPVIILFNKVDELDEQDEDDITREARNKIADVFGLDKSRNLAEEILGGSCKPWWEKVRPKRKVNKAAIAGDVSTGLNRNNFGKHAPIFLPISARNGYVYRLAPVVDQARFEMLEKDLVESLGKEQIGLRRWNKLSQDNKYKEAYEAISDSEVYEEGLRSSNFESFLKILSYCIAGEKTQTTLIELQLQIQLKTLVGYEGLANEVRVLHENMSSCGLGDADSLHGAFWSAFRCLEKQHLFLMGKTPPMVHALPPLNELIMYHGFALKYGWKDQAILALESAKLYLNRFVDSVLQRMSEPSVRSLLDLSELLAMTGNPHFEDHFGQCRAIIEMSFGLALEARVRASQLWYCRACKQKVQGYHLIEMGQRSCLPVKSAQRCPLSCGGVLDYEVCGSAYEHSFSYGFHCTHCSHWFHSPPRVECQTGSFKSFRLKDGKWTYETDEWSLPLSPNFSVPPSDPSHHGHLFWRFCQWMEKVPESDRIANTDIYVNLIDEGTTSHAAAATKESGLQDKNTGCDVHSKATRKCSATTKKGRPCRGLAVSNNMPFCGSHIYLYQRSRQQDRHDIAGCAEDGDY